jgi:thyrotropin-releasing hormone receptor
LDLNVNIFANYVLQVVKMLIVVVVVFAALWLPYRGMLVYNSFAMMFEKERFMDLWFLMFAKTCVFINRYATQKIS